MYKIAKLNVKHINVELQLTTDIAPAGERKLSPE
jgi:hypothetical protein